MASAGSGKTFTLTTEYIKLLVKNPQNYRHTLAVTFTNKATEEMKMRILTHLYGIWRQLPESKGYLQKILMELGLKTTPERVSRRAGIALHLLLHNYSYFRVETIDSFFQSVMRNLARELNLTASLRIGLNDVQVEEEAVDKLIDSLSTTDIVLQWLLRYIMDSISDNHSWNVIGAVKKFGRTIFRDYYKGSSQQLTTLMQQQGFFEDYQEQLRRIRQEAKNRMKAIGDAFISELESEGLSVADLSYGSSGVAGLFLKLQQGAFDESVLTKRVTDSVGQPEKWCTKKSPRREIIIHLAETTLGDLLRFAIEEQPRQWRLFKSADLTLRHLSQLRLLGNIEQKVRELNDEQGRFMLSDTQQLLHELIDGSDSPFIFEKIGTQLKHIMIDEFQDTSTVQWQNFKILLQETMSHEESENLIVGDVKQSIYRWRSGDWRLLAGIKEQFPDASEQVAVKPLDHNYRSAPRIVSFNNAFFTQAALTEDISAYNDVCQKVPSGKPERGMVNIMLLPQQDYEQQTLKELTLQVETLLKEGVKATDIAILVRTNSYIPIIAESFMQLMPQVKLVSDEAFRLDASQAVQTIIQALTLLSRPDDLIAKAYLLATYKGEYNGQLPERYNEALLQLPLYELTEQLYDIFQLNQMEGQSAYLCTFFDQVLEFATEKGADIRAFLEEWEKSIGAKTIQSPETDGIRIISIHKSKGLEFPYVLIPFCDWRLELPDILWCKPEEQPFNQLPIAPIDFSQKGMMGTIYEQDYLEEHQQNIVDNLNLLYVAFTRASEGLFVFGKRKATSLSRSALIEQVLPMVKEELEGAELSGQEKEEEPIIFNFGSMEKKEPKNGANKPSRNPFLQESIPVRVDIGVFAQKVDFKQSNKSSDFVHPDDDENQSRRNQYIQLGSVLHSVLSTIRDINDIPQSLFNLEQEGILYNSHLNQERLKELLSKRLNNPKVETWFEPGKWQLFNECTILTVDKDSGKSIQRRPDRVMTNGEKTIVVDFKFGQHQPTHFEQVAQYVELLKQMGYKNVEGYLWYVYSNEIEEVKA